MADYLASLDRLLGEKPGAIFPAHGPVVPGGALKLEQYRAHRLEREGLVLAALAKQAGLASPAQLVPAAYPDLTPALYPYAERSLLAHLYKLVQDGRAVQVGESFRLQARSAFP